jgi:plastocyanin
MKVRSFGSAAALAAGSCVVMIIAGCGGQEGVDSGASSKTNVVVKREKSGGGAAATTPSTPAAGGGGQTAPAAAAGGVGTLAGKVVFKGTPPTLPPLMRAGQAKDATCAKETIADQKLVVDSSGGVANVFVFLPKAPPGAAITPPPTEPAIFDNKGCHFVPHALLVRVGQPVKIENDDYPLQHNTHTLPQRDPTGGFNSTIPKEGKEFTYTRPEPEPCEVKCDIHAWMHGWQFPIDHPFAAVTGPNGEFEIKNLPAGTYSFRVWAEGAIGHYLNRNLSVTIKPGETTKIEIPYDASSFAG